MIEIIKNPAESEWKALCQRANIDDEVIDARVRNILTRVKEGGDNALKALTQEIDGSCPANFLVIEEEFEKAAAEVPQTLKDAILTAKTNIETFHRNEIAAPFEVQTIPGVICKRRI